MAGSKGERAYAWAWGGTVSPRHFLLIRKHLDTDELAYHCCSEPDSADTIYRPSAQLREQIVKPTPESFV
ncbi:hypothetical protein [Fodinicola acaciae]|uniref:hypothetical protein n=1 Tax=Fodinicola acaciae TaxID=2681555 RepID=UPI0013D52114|nr:hypothetical protein [Fodinicola acaciae]